MHHAALDNLMRCVHTLAARELPDLQLLQLFVGQRDESAFAELMRRHGPLVLCACRRVLDHEQDAEDVFQATFLVLARKAGSIRKGEAVGSWLYGVAYRLAMKEKSNASRRRLGEQRKHSAPVTDPAYEAAWRDLRRVLDDELNRLPEKQRAPFVLCCLEGKSKSEAAKELGWKEGTISSRLARVRKRLQDRLTARGITLTAAAAAVGIADNAAAAMVPALLAGSTVKAAVAFASSPGAAATVASTKALKLAATMLQSMALTPLKVGTAVMAVVCLVTAGVGLAHQASTTTVAETPPVQHQQDEQQGTSGPRAIEDKKVVTDKDGERLPEGAIARLGTRRFRVPHAVEALAFAPNGKMVAVSSMAGLVLFDATSGKRLKRLAQGGWARETLLAFSPDSKQLAGRALAIVGERDGVPQAKRVIRIWDLDGESKPRDYDPGNTIWVGWAADGQPLAICHEPGALRMRELAAGRSRRFECKDVATYEPFGYTNCDCAPAGQTLAVVDERSVVYVWDTATARQRCTFQRENTYFRHLALSRDGRNVAVFGYDRSLQDRPLVQLRDAATGRVVGTLAADQDYLAAVNTMAYSADGKTLATAGWRGVRFWDVATGKERSRTQGPGYESEKIAFSASPETLASAERHSGAWHLWDVATGKRKPEPVGHESFPHGTAFSPDGRRAATGSNGTIHIWDLATGKSLLNIQRPGRSVGGIAFSTDGGSLYSAWTGEDLWVCDAATGERRHAIKLEDPERPDTYQSAVYMHLSADGKTLVARSHYYPRNNAGPNYQDTLITGWDTSTRTQLFRRRLPGTPFYIYIVVSADTRQLVVPYPPTENSKLEELQGGSVSRTLRLEDLATGEPLMTLPALEGVNWALAMSPDSRLLASNNSDSKRRKKGDPTSTGTNLVLWEVATGTEVVTLPAHHQHRAAFSRDGRLLAMTAPLQEILVWDLAHGRPLRRFKGFDADVTDLAFSPDGRRLISGLVDTTLLVWDLGTRATLTGRKIGAESVAKAWTDLASTDAPSAFRARWLLASSPEEVVPLLKEKLRPAQAADGERLRRLLADLNSDRFATRQQAQKELAELAELAVPALRRALAEKPSLEARRRIEALLENLRKPITRPEAMRTVRAVAVLEDMGTPQSRKLLEELAKGTPEARLTQEAKAALVRLELRGSRP